MLKYPMAEIGNKLYDYYVVRYGVFLKNIRYVEYSVSVLLYSLLRNGQWAIGLDLITSIFFLITQSS